MEVGWSVVYLGCVFRGDWSVLVVVVCLGELCEVSEELQGSYGVRELVWSVVRMWLCVLA